MLFLGIDSVQQQEAESPSLYNTAEANEIVSLTWDLLNARHLGLSESDIAVIAPFRHQACLHDIRFEATLTHVGHRPASEAARPRFRAPGAHPGRDRRRLSGMLHA